MSKQKQEEKKVRITFSAEVYINGKDLAEIKDKWENLPLFSAEAIEEAYADFVELVSVEDADTYEDIMTEFRKAYDLE